MENIKHPLWKEYEICSDNNQLDFAKTATLIREHDWSCKDRPLELTIRALSHSLNFVILCQGEPVGMVRVVTDYATFAYYTDVIVAKAHRGKGLGKWLLEAVTSHPVLKVIRRSHLITPDAHGLYQKYGFTKPAHMEEYMERVVPYEISYRDILEADPQS